MRHTEEQKQSRLKGQAHEKRESTWGDRLVRAFRPLHGDIAAREVAIFLVVGIVAVATWIPRIGGPISLHWDAGAYYVLGTSLAHGQGYRLLSEPGNLQTTLHPPVLPAFAAVHQIVLGTSDFVTVGRALRLSFSFLSIGYALAIYALLRSHLPWIYALLGSLFSICHPAYIYFSDSFYAETIFGLLTLLFFFCYRRRSNGLSFVLAALCAVLAYGTRTAGIALFAAWVSVALLNRQWRQAGLRLAVALVPVLSWMAYIAAVESSPQYQHPAYAYQRADYVYQNVSYAKNIFRLSDPFTPERGPLTTRRLLKRVYVNVLSLPAAMGQAVSTWHPPLSISLPLALLICAGLVLQTLRKQYLFPLYIGFSLAVMCLTPFPAQFLRYLMPLVPLLFLALFEALAAAVGWLRARRSRRWRVMGAFLALTVIGVVAEQELSDLLPTYTEWYDDVAYRQNGLHVSYKEFFYAPKGREFDAALDWLQDRAKAGEIVATSDPQWVYLRTGLKAVLPPFEIDASKAQHLVDTVPVRYLIRETGSRAFYYRYTSPLIEQNAAAWRCIWRGAGRAIEIDERVDDPNVAMVQHE